MGFQMYDMHKIGRSIALAELLVKFLMMFYKEVDAYFAYGVLEIYCVWYTCMFCKVNNKLLGKMNCHWNQS